MFTKVVFEALFLFSFFLCHVLYLLQTSRNITLIKFLSCYQLTLWHYMILILLSCLLSLLLWSQLSFSSLKLSVTLKALTLSSLRLQLLKTLRHSSNTSRTTTQKSLSSRTTMNLWFSKLSSFKTLSVYWITLLSLWLKRTQSSLSIKSDWKYNWRLYTLSNYNSESQILLSLRDFQTLLCLTVVKISWKTFF